jgi:hypothetical protein
MLSVLPALAIHIVPRITIIGDVGLSYYLDYINMYSPTNSWVNLTTIVVTSNPQYYFDVSALGQPARFYRLQQVP